MLRARATAIAVALLAIGLAGCSKPDASYVTSPSMLALVGTAVGEVTYFPDSPPPEPIPDPPGWKFDLGNARYEELENFDASIQVVGLLVTGQAGRMEMWLSDSAGTSVWLWEAGPAGTYSGTLCFQLALVEDEVAVPLDEAESYTLTMAFYEEDGSLLAARRIGVAGRVPEGLDELALPDEGAIAGRTALACPRAPL